MSLHKITARDTAAGPMLAARFVAAFAADGGPVVTPSDGQATTLTGTVAATTVNYVNATTYDPFGNVSQIAEHNPAVTYLSYDRDPHTLALTRSGTYGSEAGAMEQIVRSLDGAALPSSGLFKVTTQVGGQSVVVSGAVVDGVPRIGTAFTP